ncbi:hypothetical protein H0H93_004602, partial [Arthromyces matolae]
MEKLSMFDFEVIYVPGSENILSDALSRIYSNDAPGTVRSPSELLVHDEIDGVPPSELSRPVLTGLEGAYKAIGNRMVEGETVTFLGGVSSITEDMDGGATIFERKPASGPRRSSRLASKSKENEAPSPNKGTEGGSIGEKIVD